MPSPAINNAKILFVALLTLALDQLTKWVVIQKLPLQRGTSGGVGRLF